MSIAIRWSVILLIPLACYAGYHIGRTLEQQQRVESQVEKATRIQQETDAYYTSWTEYDRLILDAGETERWVYYFDTDKMKERIDSEVERQLIEFAIYSRNNSDLVAVVKQHNKQSPIYRLFQYRRDYINSDRNDIMYTEVEKLATSILN